MTALSQHDSFKSEIDFNLIGETLMFQIRFAIFLTLALSFCLPATLTAQPPEGEFVILSAQYGTEFHHVDVTQRLREAARHERMIHLDNRTFGVDPEKGVPKMLRIYARGPEGHERMFEYREGSVIDGGQFRGWDRGEWGNGGWSGRWEGGEPPAGGDFLILSAQYGTEIRHVDVTQRLREVARDHATILLDNRLFGVDPDKGVPKMLRIYARGPEGHERMFEYREGTVIDGGQFRGWGRGEWGNGGWSGRWEGGEPR
jgi:hypothetical protein